MSNERAGSTSASLAGSSKLPEGRISAAGDRLRSPIVDIPDVGKVVEFADTEDNIAYILQYVAGHPLAAK